MTSRTVRTVLGLGIATVLLWATQAEAQRRWSPGDFGSTRFRLGLTQPEGGGSYWDEKQTVWTGSGEDLEDLVWGIDGRFMLTPTVGIQAGWEYASGSVDQAYLDWVDGNGNDIVHRTTQTTNEFNALVVFRPVTRSVVRPVLGIGGGWLLWDLEESGRFIDFDHPSNDVFTTTYYASGSTLSALAMVGFDVRVTRGWALFVEGRYRWAEDDLGDDFAGLAQTLNLAGYQLSAGISLDF